MERSSKYENYTREQLLAEVEKLSKRKKYGLVWEEEKTQEQFEKEAEGKLPVLVEDKKREIETDPAKPVNILIEGDNYHALSVLNYTHSKSIDVIYIDPPYNTGNKDFKYNDQFIDREDTFRHSKWIAFMSKRLKLAKNLLKDTGVIFISIDDNEIANLKLLCDDIFLENNFIALLPTIMNLKGNQDEFGFAGTHEYTLVYSKNKGTAKFGEFPVEEEELEKWDEDEIGFYKKGAPLRATGEESNRADRTKMFYPILVDKKTLKIDATISEPEYLSLYDENLGSFNDENLKKIIKKYEKEFHVVLPFNEDGSYGRWRWGWSLKNIEKMKTDAIVNTSGKIITLYKKQRPEIGDFITKKPKSIFYKPEYSSSSATSFLKKVFGGAKAINNPKPIELIKDLLLIGGNINAVALDFFAGSGTTGQAVLELNRGDGGNRQFILCTNNENNICTDVCYPRVKKVTEGYKNSKGEKVQGLGGNLKYYKTDFVFSEPSHRNKRLLTLKSIEMLCVKENTFQEVKAQKDYFIFSSKEKYTAILLDESSLAEFKKEISWLKLPVSVYVFALEDYDYSDEFSDIKHDIAVCTIPEAILKVYRRIYRKGQLKLKMYA
jgi:adenine-specific DNA-methyltransferase